MPTDIPDHATETASYYVRKYQAAMAELEDLANLLGRPVNMDGSLCYADLLPYGIMETIRQVDELNDNQLLAQLVQRMREHNIID